MLLTMSMAALTACGGGGGGPDAAPAATVAVSATAAVPAAAAAGSVPAITAMPAAASDLGSSAEPAPAPSNTSAVTVIKVRASSNAYAGAGAAVTVQYNGATIGAFDVLSTEPLDYSVTTTTTVGGGSLDLVFSNAADAQGRQVRALKIESVTVGSTVILPHDSQVTFDRGQGTAAFDGQGVLSGRSLLTRSGALRIALAAVRTAAATSQSTGFYVDATNGNDADAGSIERPWRTLSRLSGIRLQAAQGIFLRCGSLWRETLTLSSSQLVDGSTIAGYGNECGSRKAVISGADDFSGSWVRTGEIWSRNLPAGTPKITQLFIAGEPMRTAQWPDDVSNGRSKAAAAGASALNRVALHTADVAALGNRDLAGATILVRSQPWSIESRKVTASTGGALTLSQALLWSVESGESFVLQDKLWMLDSPGEFFHDVAAQKLYLMAPAVGVPADLNAALVEGSVRDTGLALSGRSALDVHDIGVRATRAEGLHLLNTPQATVTRIEALDNALHGVRIDQSERMADGVAGPTLRNSLLSGNGQYGVKAEDSLRVTVSGNTVLATGDGTQHVASVQSAIAVGPGAQVVDNTIDGAGYLGVAFSARGNALIARNAISGYCTRLSDCGAIYTWQGRDYAAAAQSATVEFNRVLEGVAELAGAVSAEREVVVGVYLDDFTSNVIVRNNVLAGTPIGVFLHNASNITVENNQIWLPRLVGMWASMDQTDADWLRGNVFRNNELAPLVQATKTGTDAAPGLPAFTVAQAVWFWHATAGEAALTAGRNTFSGNRVVQLHGTPAVHALLRGPGGERTVDSVAWQGLNPAEPQVLQPAFYDPLKLAFGANLIVGGSFDSGLQPWQSYRNPAGSGFDVRAVGALAGCAGPCVSLTAGTQGDLLASPAFSLRPGALYAYRWSAVSATGAVASIGSPYVSRDGTPYDQMADARGYVGYRSRQAAGTVALNYETFFVAKSDAAARVNLQLETLRVPVAFDSVSLQEVTGYTVAQLADWSALAFAPANAMRTVACSDFGWPAGCTAIGLDGQPIALPLALAAGTQKLLLRADSAFRR